MKKYNSLKEIEKDIAITPWEKHIEKVIFLNPQSLAMNAPDLLRRLAAMQNTFKSDLHYHSSPQIVNHIQCVDDLILAINR